MGLLADAVEAGERQLGPVCGNLHRETGADAGGALSVHKSKALNVSWCELSGDLNISEENSEYMYMCIYICVCMKSLLSLLQHVA